MRVSSSTLVYSLQLYLLHSLALDITVAYGHEILLTSPPPLGY